MFDSVGWVWSAAARATQVGLESAPYLLCGLVAAAILRVLVPAEAVRRFFADPGPAGVMRAWGVAALLPVDALGVLPVARQLSRTGVAPGTVVTFALAAPLLNPLSLVYALTRNEPVVVLGLVAIPLTLTVGLGLLVNRWTPAIWPQDTKPEVPAGATGGPRLAALGLAMAWEVTGPVLVYVVASLVGAAAVGAAMPDALYRLNRAWPTATDLPLGLAAAALPAVAGPEKAMLMAGNLLEADASFGMALTFMLFAAGLDLGSLVWLFTTFRGRLAVRALAAWLALALAAGCVGHWLGGAARAAEETQAKAFGGLGRLNEGETAAGAVQEVAAQVGATQAGAFGILAALVLAGVVARRTGDRATPDAVLRRGIVEPTPAGEGTVWNRPVPVRYLVLLGLAGGLGAAVAGVYAYYPGPAVLFEDMKAIRDEALRVARLGSRAKAVEQVRVWERQVRKLPVGVLLREGGLAASQREQTDRLIGALERLRLALEEGSEAEVEAAIQDARTSYDRCRAELVGEGGR